MNNDAKAAAKLIAIRNAAVNQFSYPDILVVLGERMDLRLAGRFRYLLRRDVRFRLEGVRFEMLGIYRLVSAEAGASQFTEIPPAYRVPELPHGPPELNPLEWSGQAI